MSFARKVWKFLVAVKDGLVLLMLLMFFGLLYAALSYRPTPASVTEGALLVTLDGVVVEEPQAIDPLSLIVPMQAATREHRAADVIRAIEGAASDDKIKAVALDLDYFLGAGQVTLSDIGRAMDKVRAAKKPVLVHAIAYSADSAQLAAHASEVWMDPMGGALLAGPGGTYLFWGEAADKYGVNVHIYRAGRYKSAVETYSRSSFSDDARSDIGGALDSLWEQWRGEVARVRPKAKLDKLISDPAGAIADAGGDPAQAALKSGLVDKLGSRKDFGAHVASIVGEDDDLPDDPAAFAHTSYETWLRASPAKKPGKSIGVVTIAGTIVDGDAGPGTAGGDRIAEILDDALDDDLAALVVRVDSPGGSVTASEVIRQSILRHKEAGIPVVVSMGNIAASGGYWVATPGDAIFAEPSTVTGSIGVFATIPSFENTLGRFSVRTDSLGTTPLSGQPDVFGGFSEQMDAVLQAQVTHSYDTFLELVQESRKIDRAKALTLAEGRTWTGGSARQVGLVDRLGGLDDALAYAAKEAGLDDGEWHASYLKEKPDPLTMFVQDLTAPKEETVRVGLPELLVAHRNARLSSVVEDVESMIARPTIQARCTTCPVPARLLSVQADTPRWLRAAEMLFAN